MGMLTKYRSGVALPSAVPCCENGEEHFHVNKERDLSFVEVNVWTSGTTRNSSATRLFIQWQLFKRGIRSDWVMTCVVVSWNHDSAHFE